MTGSLGATDLAGKRLNDFELLSEIGRGATGVVYLARQVSLNRKVAVKVLAPDGCSSTKQQKGFRREALAASRLRHPNIVAILKYGEARGLRYIAMEYFEGRSLREHIRDMHEQSSARSDSETPSGMDPTLAAKTVLGIARALEHCHDCGVIHRDIKPQNVLLDSLGDPRLVDFGLAKHVDLESVSRNGDIAGTPHYMSPEQAQGLGSKVDHRTDIYSAGVVLYEMLTLEKPFDGSNVPAVLYGITHERPRSILRLSPTTPKPLAAICTKAMSRRSDDRYQTASDFSLDLQHFLSDKPVLAPAPSLWRRAYESVSSLHPRAAAVLVVLLLAEFINMNSPRTLERAPSRVDLPLERSVEAGIAPLPTSPTNRHAHERSPGAPPILSTESNEMLNTILDAMPWPGLPRTEAQPCPALPWPGGSHMNHER
jgi:serine/threonine protein kinase